MLRSESAVSFSRRTAGQLPGSVDGGEASAEIAAALSSLLTSVGELATTVEETGTRVAQSRANYADADLAAQQSFDAVRSGL